MLSPIYHMLSHIWSTCLSPIYHMLSHIWSTCLSPIYYMLSHTWSTCLSPIYRMLSHISTVKYQVLKGIHMVLCQNVCSCKCVCYPYKYQWIDFLVLFLILLIPHTLNKLILKFESINIDYELILIMKWSFDQCTKD